MMGMWMGDGIMIQDTDALSTADREKRRLKDGKRKLKVQQRLSRCNKAQQMQAMRTSGTH